jgi:hypothetical protein
MKKLLILFLFINIVYAQNISVSNFKFEKKDNSYYIKGKISLSNLTPKGQLPESDIVYILIDIPVKKNFSWPILPSNYTYWTNPPYWYKGKKINEDKIKGVNVKTITIWKWDILNSWENCTYTGKNGELKINVNKCIHNATKDFEVKIPKKLLTRLIRIRAVLNHQYGGPYANWHPKSLHHYIIYKGIYKKVDKKLEAKRKKFEKFLNVIKSVKKARDRNKDKQRYKKGMHKFKRVKLTNYNNVYGGKNINKLKNILKKKKFKLIKFKDKNGVEHIKIDKRDSKWKDYCKKYIKDKIKEKFLENLPSGLDKVLDSKVDDELKRILHITKIKEIELTLGVDKKSAALYDKFSSIEDEEKKWDNIKYIGEKASGGFISKIFSYLPNYFKKHLALVYKNEYEKVKSLLKKGYRRDEIEFELEVENSGHRGFLKLLMNAYSKNKFKDPKNRLDVYLKLIKAEREGKIK